MFLLSDREMRFRLLAALCVAVVNMELFNTRVSTFRLWCTFGSVQLYQTLLSFSVYSSYDYCLLAIPILVIGNIATTPKLLRRWYGVCVVSTCERCATQL